MKEISILSCKIPTLVVLLIRFLLYNSYTDAQNQINFVNDSLVGHLSPSSLDKLAYKYGHVNKSTKQRQNVFINVLKTFPRLLIQHEDIDEESSLQYSSTSEIVRAINSYNAETNQDFEPNKTDELSVELWISFYSQNSISKIGQQILQLVNVSKATSCNLITTVLLDYKELHLTQVTLPLVKHQVSRASGLFKVRGNLTFGVVLDLKNCEQHLQKIEELLTKIDIIIFRFSKVYYRNKFGLQDILLQAKYKDCHQRAFAQYNHTKIKFGYISKWSVSVNETNDNSLELKNVRTLNKLKRWRSQENVTMILDVVLQNKPIRNDTTISIPKHANSNGSVSRRVDDIWIRKPASFSQFFFGVTVSTKNDVIVSSDNLLTQIISTIFKTLKKVLIFDEQRNNATNSQNMKYIVTKIANYKTQIVQEQETTGADYYENQIPIQVLIGTYTSFDDVQFSLESVDTAFSIATTSNDIYPETVTTILLNCGLYNVDEDSFNGNESGINWDTYIAPVIAHANKTKTFETNSSSLQIGIILPERFCNLYSSSNRHTNLGLVDMIVFKQSVSLDEVYNDTSTALEMLSAKFGNCKTRVEQHYENVAFLVELTNCENGNHTSVREMVNYIMFWENLNIWAKRERSEVFVETGFDDPQNNLFCGWWKVIQNSSNGTFVVENKKTYTLKMLESRNRIKTLFNNSEHRFIQSTQALSDSINYNTFLYTILPITGVVIFLTTTAAYLAVKYRNIRSKYILTKKEAETFFMGVENRTEQCKQELETACRKKVDGNSDAHNKPYDKDLYEISKSSFEIDFEKCLGSGEFGSVHFGSVKKEEGRLTVAVKMIKEAGSNSIALKGLLSEIKVLSYVGEHKHILKLIGAYTRELRVGKVYVFLELCEIGSLEKHLKELQASMDHLNTEESSTKRYCNIVKKPSLNASVINDLIRWSIEICKGMEFLASKNVIHADLATRNVLLDAKMTAKVADFGLSRRLYNYTNYVKQNHQPLPWRWMAPESIKRLEFSEKTDVWAFGITLFEIFTLGDQPYPGLDYQVDFVSWLEKGLRAGEPTYHPEGLYEHMKACWSWSPYNRPKFSELGIALEEIYVKLEKNG